MASSYPILDNKQLLTCLNEMDVRLTAEQLMKPTPDVVRNAFEHLVTMLLGVTKEEMEQPVFEAIDELEYPELYDEAIPVLTFFKYLRQLMDAAGYHDISMRDLTKPEEHRLRRQLSAVVNFARFREGKLELYLNWQEATEVLLREQAELADANAQLKAELQRVEEERAAQEPEVARLRADTAAICAENTQLASEQTQLQQEGAALQAEAKDQENGAERQRLQLEAAREEADRLRGQIVESPEALRRSLEELQGAVAAEKEAAAAADRRCRELAAREEAISKVEQQLGAALEQLDGLGADMEKKRLVSRRVKALRADIAAKEHEAAQLRTEHEGLSRKKDILQEAITRHEQQSKLKRDAAAAQVEQQQKEKEAIQADNAATLAKLTEQESLRRSLQERVTELEAAHISERENMLSQYQALLHQVEVYHSKLGEVMQPKPISQTPLKPLTPNVR